MRNKTVMGIDIGTAIVGWAVLQKSVSKKNNNDIQVVDYGVITTDSRDEMPSRLHEIWEGISVLIKEFKPDDLAVESLFYFKNQKTIMTVSQARGVVLQVGESFGLNIYEYTPLQVKSAVTGYGRADKKQVQQMVKVILGLEEIPKPDDAADALAIAINHLNSNLLDK